jgi:uncharacterized repeat protein (TIGR03803 family)
MTPTGTITTLVNFSSYAFTPTDNATGGSILADGYAPNVPLALGKDGNFYGTTGSGGSLGVGTVFKMTPGGTLTTLVNFNNTNGAYPSSGLVQGSDGNFYGTTSQGGTSTSCGTNPSTGLPYGCGTAFKMTPSGTLTALASFSNVNGARPGALVQASDGNFYGATFFGNSSTNCGINSPTGTPYGCGTIFKMTPSGILTTLLNFNNTNGANPLELIEGSDGNLYGVTNAGGSSTNCGTNSLTGLPYGCGTVFKLNASLAPFAPALTGYTPNSGPVGTSVVITGSNLIGTTSVKFSNGISASFTINSDKQITARIPNGAMTGPFSVTTPGGTYNTATSFTVTP